MHRRLPIILAISTLALQASADTLKLANGDTLNGEILAWAVDHVVIDHPQLGEILIGNDQGKLVRQNLHPTDLFWQVDRNWAWLKAELEGLPRISLANGGALCFRGAVARLGSCGPTRIGGAGAEE